MAPSPRRRVPCDRFEKRPGEAARALLGRFPVADPGWQLMIRQWCALDPPRVARLLRKLDACDDLLPGRERVFAALDATPFERVRVLILGQDPYPNPGDAHGLAFSVPHRRLPPSLRNIFTEVSRDQGGGGRIDGNLTDWAAQGVLLLNRCLTVSAHRAGSHQRWGWHDLTAFLVERLAARGGPLVALLWGAPARSLAPLFAGKDDVLVLQAMHPSPLAYHRPGPDGFRACGHFARANAFLAERGQEPILWL